MTSSSSLTARALAGLACLLSLSAAPAAAGEREDYLCADTQKPFFREARRGSGDYVPDRRNSAAGRFVMPKPAGVKRVFFMGESAAALLGGQRTLGPGLEIVNWGMGAYESSRILETVEEALAFSPDLLVVLSGNNEAFGDPCPGLGPELLRRKARLLERYHSGLEGAVRGPRKAIMETHEGRLREMAALAKKAGVPLVFALMPANLRDMPPQGQFPYGAPGLYAGARLLWAGRYEAAAQELAAAAQKAPEEPFARFYLGRALDASGRRAEAEKYYKEAAALDKNIYRVSEEHNALIARVAAEEQVCSADLPGLFEKLAGGAPGFDIFDEQVHWRPEFNKAAGRVLLEAAAPCGFRAGRAAESLKLDARGKDEGRRRLSYAASWLGWRPGELSEPALAELAYLGRAFPSLFKAAAASPAALESRMLKNFWSLPFKAAAVFPVFLAHLAELELRGGRPAAALALAERGLALSPGAETLRFVKARALAEAGEAAAARAEFGALAAAGWGGGAPGALAAFYAPGKSLDSPEEK